MSLSVCPCLLSAQLFSVQVSISWGLAVCSQEVASAKVGEGAEGWSAVLVKEN